MVREPVIRGGGGDDAGGPPDRPPAYEGPSDDDRRLDEELRPQRLADVVGQREVVDRLRIMLNAARKRNAPLGHLLLDGPPGLGKTTFATVLPRELGTECQITSGPVLTAPKDLLPYLTNAGQGSVLFIDEIHRLPAAVEEFIYPVMEDFRVDISLGEGLNARIINMKLKPFTVIGATTRSGLLTAPLRDRFVNRERLEFYETEDLAEIVVRNARKLKTIITPEATQEIARRSRGTPRVANNLLRWTRDYADSEADGQITTEVARDALAKREVDQLGLDRQDRRYLMTVISVFGGGPAGLSAIGHSMNVSTDTLEDEVEPFLLRCGLIQRTPRGRIVTAAAFEHLHISPPNPDDPQGKLF
jgi:Holliday junction DNA helicase RuvB